MDTPIESEYDGGVKSEDDESIKPDGDERGDGKII